MNRREEVRRLLRLSPEEVRERAGARLVVCPTLAALHAAFAGDLYDEFAAARREGRAARLIVPVGPVGQYRVLAERLNRERFAITDAWLFFMDEYEGEDGRALPPDHPLSFRGIARREFLDLLAPELRPRPECIVFPCEDNIDRLAEMIEAVGGIDACFGGIGIHGHVAFNEPEPGVRDSGPRRVTLNDFTVTMNAIRAHVGGNLECFPRRAFTLGMRQILGARRIRLYCRNGCPLDWANTVLRLALFGSPADDYPVTWTTLHPDVRITTDEATLASPKHLI